MILNRLNLRNYYYIQAHLLSVLFLFVDSQSQPRMVSHMLYFSMNYSTLLEPLVCGSGKLLLTCDLNFHVNNPSEGKAHQFLDILSCFNLNALNFNIPIHKSNNLLDLNYYQIQKTPLLIYQSTTRLSRNTLLSLYLDFERPSNKKVVLTSRKLSREACHFRLIPKSFTYKN